MYSNNRTGNRAASARGFVALWVALVMGLALVARPAEAAPFAYVPNGNDVSVIDTATNTVVATVPVGNNPFGPAVTPDGTHVYAANLGDGTVSVIATASNTVVATVTVGRFPQGVAVTRTGNTPTSWVTLFR
jgi:YVTN family beta-propeller protein